MLSLVLVADQEGVPKEGFEMPPGQESRQPSSGFVVFFFPFHSVITKRDYRVSVSGKLITLDPGTSTNHLIKLKIGASDSAFSTRIAFQELFVVRQL